MRKLMLVFLMLLLPLQWTIALAADCCLRHDVQTQTDHHAQMMQMDHADHQTHVQTTQQNDDSQQSQSDCEMNCGGCAAHHSVCAVVEVRAVVPVASSAKDNTPYLSRITSPLSDNLYRPPLVALI